MSCCSGSNTTAFAFDSPALALEELCSHISPIDTEAVDWPAALGRVLAMDVTSDRPSPSCDVSAMDGYALRVEECRAGVIKVGGEIHIGQEPPKMAHGKAMQIVTGAPVPAEAHVVIKREDVIENEDSIELSQELVDLLKPGANIRRIGENMKAGTRVQSDGRLVTAPMIGMLTGFGVVKPTVYKRVRVGIITTGNEVVRPDQTPNQWQLRDSNSPAIRGLCDRYRWIQCDQCVHARDSLDGIVAEARSLIDSCDALVFTGGVSMGDHDHVPAVVDQLGAKTVFHKLPQRPGKPALGAVLDGKPIFGLPGNPVSVMVTAHRLLLPALAVRAGLAQSATAPRMMRVVNSDEKQLGLWWSRLARVVGDDQVELVASKGSGDVPSSAMSDGFVEFAPNQTGPGPWAFWSWDG